MRPPLLIALVVASAALLAGVLAASAVAVACAFDMGGHMRAMHGGGRDTSGAAVVAGGMAANVEVEDFAFSPGNLRVPAGATVTWTNRDAAPHDATARDGGWKTERLSRGESATLTFDAPGEYDYFCSIHSDMKARLVVR